MSFGGHFRFGQNTFCRSIGTFRFLDRKDFAGGSVRFQLGSEPATTVSWSGTTERLRVDIGFFGARGVTAGDGLMESDLDEAQLKQRMVKASTTVIGLADASKFGSKFVSVFALPQEIHRVITDVRAPASITSMLQDRGIRVSVV